MNLVWSKNSFPITLIAQLMFWASSTPVHAQETTSSVYDYWLEYYSSNPQMQNTGNVNLNPWSGGTIFTNTTGSDNAAGGSGALADNTTGSLNTAIGSGSLYSNTTGSANSAFGVGALEKNITGHSNVAVGAGALNGSSADYNTAVGTTALYSTTSGHENTAVGLSSMLNNTTGSGNVAVGVETLINNVTGENNTVLGNHAGNANISGSGNVFIGYNAGSSETGSNKLYVSNSNTTAPLIYGEFDNEEVVINGDLDINGSIVADAYYDSTGAALIQKDQTTGAVTVTTDQIVTSANVPYVRKDAQTGSVHIGQNSFVFDDASGTIGNGTDIMSSSVGKLQFGIKDTDVTTFIGSVHVPKPTQSSHAATRKYVDTTAAMAAAMDTRLPANGKQNRLSIGYAQIHGVGATALNYVSIVEGRGVLSDIGVSAAYSNYSGSMGKLSIGWSW